jgi:hypothetical protein
MKIPENDNYEEFTVHTLDDWQKEWEEEHPILNWVDGLFKDRSIADYRASYTITHPWIIFPFAWRHICWAWQRIFRQWDDRVIWSIDYYLAKMIPIWMRQLKKDKHGIPGMAFRKEDLQNPSGEITDHAFELAKNLYDDVLEDIAIGFENYKENEDTKNPIFEKGFDLFRKWFGTFWD